MKRLTVQKARALRVRAKIKGTGDKPRLSIYRSNKHIYAQIIDDSKKKTIVGISEKELTTKEKVTKTEKSKQLGTLIAKKAIENKVKEVIFDRGSYRYHGRVKALAEGAREGGLKF